MMISCILKMKVHLYCSTIAVLLLFWISSSLAVTSKLRSKQSALRNLAAYAEENGETTCSDDIEEILYFMTLGYEDIETTEVGDVIIVIGPSGVGKSTLTQFVANETNTLRAVCEEDDVCFVVDDSNAIGGDLLLPNLVLHESTQTPFYDMPGFNSNRNDSMEIANSFFMQQLLEDAERVKILVLARFSSFENSARLDFTALLRYLVDLINSPAKFRGGIAIVSTMAPNCSHENIIGRNIKFLKEFLLENVSTLFQGEDKYIRGSTEILENWLESDTGNLSDAKYYSYFLAVRKSGLLLEDDRLRENKQFLEEVIWDRLQFVPIEIGDFGLPSLSEEAKLKISEVGLCVSRSLATKMDEFGEDMENYIRISVSNLIDGKKSGFVHIFELITNFTASDFTFKNMEKQPLSTYLKKLLSEVNSLEFPSLGEIRLQIIDTLTVLQFIELKNVEILFDPKQWVSGVKPIKRNLIEYFQSQVKELLDATISWFAQEADEIAELILTKIESLDDISEQQNLVSSKVVRIKNMFQKINCEIPTKNLTQFLAFYLSEFNSLKDFPSYSDVPHFNALSVLEMFNDFSWSSKDWTSPSISTLQYPLENERDLIIFLRALCADLSQPIVQTGEDLELYTWWSNQTRLTPSKFNCFYSKIIIEGFTSPYIFHFSRVKEFLFYKTKARKRLESLLNFMLRNVYTCPNEPEIFVSGPIISFDRFISRCINQQRTTTTIVLLATHKIYANAKLMGSQINSDNNINVILMSPELIVSNNAEIDLSGNIGQQGVDGKPAGTQYLLFQNITTDDESIFTRIIIPNVTGGPGVDGSVGSRGTDTTQTGSNNFNVETDDCAAWATGHIQIRTYVNDCNQCCCSMDCVCYAGSDGIYVNIIGLRGPIGGKGGDGKDGSCGGAGGQSYSVDANYFSLPKTASDGLQGKNGDGGAGGPGGLGGLNGPIINVRIRMSGWLSRYCAESERKSISSTEWGPTGPSGNVGKSCTIEKTRKSVYPTTVNYYFGLFKEALEGLTTNQFFSSQTKSLLNLLGSAKPLNLK